MSIYEYDEERHMQKEREASREEGNQIGMEKGMIKGVEKSREATLKLTLLLIQAGRTEDLKRAGSCPLPVLRSFNISY